MGSLTGYGSVHCTYKVVTGYNYPLTFFKKASGILQSPPSVRLSIKLSPPKLLDEIQPNLVCDLITWKGCATAHFFWPRPLGPWGGAKRSNIIKYHLISITKSISKIFKPNCVCLLTNERYKPYQTGFSFPCLGHAPGVGLGGTVGGWVVQKNFFSEIQPDLVCE